MFQLFSVKADWIIITVEAAFVIDLGQRESDNRLIAIATSYWCKFLIDRYFGPGHVETNWSN